MCKKRLRQESFSQPKRKKSDLTLRPSKKKVKEREFHNDIWPMLREPRSSPLPANVIIQSVIPQVNYSTWDRLLNRILVLFSK